LPVHSLAFEGGREEKNSEKEAKEKGEGKEGIDLLLRLIIKFLAEKMGGGEGREVQRGRGWEKRRGGKKATVNCIQNQTSFSRKKKWGKGNQGEPCICPFFGGRGKAG